ncbi:MAG: hypothetical protein LBL87_04590 [Ruminococcus sp.]|jgi:hypothetical protein|nr:hypothetical protein [Ruminococcus sp.]
MNADKYKQAISGVRFSPDFELKLKRRLKGETLIKMTPAKKSPFHTAALAGMSIAACFICFFAVKIASERLDAGLVSEPAVTSFETSLDSLAPENGTVVIGSPRQSSDEYGYTPAAGDPPEAAADAAGGVQTPQPNLFGEYGTGAPPASVFSAAQTYRPEVALEGLLAAYDSGTFVVSDGEFKTTETGTTVVYDKAEAAEENDTAANSTATDSGAFSDTVRAYLAKVVDSGERKSFAEHATGEQQYRIDINGEDGTLLYSVWVFDNCVLVERFAPDGLMKAYIEVHG